MRTSNILSRLEEATGKPVVSALQATIWGTLRLADAPSELPGLGFAVSGSRSRSRLRFERIW